MNLVSLFSGAGGLDLGFKQAGFSTIWANEFDKGIWATFKHNFPNIPLDKRDLTKIPMEDIPCADGFIGGPSCQSWSEAGAGRGIKDPRGQLFLNYVDILKHKQPLFFLAENVSGILAEKHSNAFNTILHNMDQMGYNVSYSLINANDYGVAQDRERVIIVGYHKVKVGKIFKFPNPLNYKPTLKDAIDDLPEPLSRPNGKFTLAPTPPVLNHEYMEGTHSYIFMSRNRVRSWNEPSFTIQAGARHAPLHPQAPKMPLVSKDVRIFEPGSEHLYRRLSVRECARIQTFPDTFEFKYDNISDGYKMIGNAVPVELARQIAIQIKSDLDII